jgi:DNA-binding response OmpR family regulator
METILVIDDDASLRDTLSVMLEREGFLPVVADDGRAGYERALALKPRLILVDLKMPRLSGAEVCKRLRARGMKTPLIVLSAAAGELDKVQLLDIGSDDYVVKPFVVRELLARIRAVLRRTTPEETKVLEFGENAVDLTRRVVARQGQELKLTRAEYNLLTYFLQNPDRVLTREAILNSVWGYDYCPHTRTVDAHVVRLRQKLEPDAARPRHFLTVHGVGYRFLP